MRPRQQLGLAAVLVTCAAFCCAKASIQACNDKSVPCGIGVNPCENPSYNPCKGESGHQCWYEACGDDDSVLCNISCRKDDMVSITGMIEMPDETVTASGNNNVEPSNGDGESSHFPGIITVPSLQDVSSGGAPVVLRNSSAGGSICPDGNPPVNCVFDPCAATTCLAGTTCVSNYCGGCNAECVPQCPDGSSPVNCLVNPCATTLCPLGQQCVSDYCGGCNARCVAVPANSTVNSTAGSSGPGVITGPNVAPAEEDCPADKPPVDCNFNPCDGIRCLDGLVCKPTFCGTCGYTCQPHGAPVDPSAACPYNACSRVRCEPSAYKTVCQRDSRSCNYRCVALQPPPCEAGSGFSATSRRCKPCKAGYVSSAGSNVCAACAVDYYSSRDHTTCLPCPPGYSTNGLFGVSRCSKVKTIDG